MPHPGFCRNVSAVLSKRYDCRRPYGADQCRSAKVVRICDVAATGKGAAKRSAADRAQARKALRSQLEAISRIAKALKLSQFLMPRDKGDIATVDTGQSFAQHAQPLKQLFIDNHLPADFIDQ